LTLDQSSTNNVTSTLPLAGYYTENALLTATGQGSTINNQETIVDNGAVSLLLTNSGVHGGNSGDITAHARTGEDNRNALSAA
ncbi:hypothetical protein SE10_22575, partial [Salmonella enterica subsp. enterica serovar Mbandaka]